VQEAGVQEAGVQEAGVQEVQAYPKKFWCVENLRKIPENLGKIRENLGKIPDSLGKNGAQRRLTSKNDAQCLQKHMKTFFWRSHQEKIFRQKSHKIFFRLTGKM